MSDPSPFCQGKQLSGKGGSSYYGGDSQDCAPLSVMSEMVAPAGSVMTQKRPVLGMSVGGTQTLPPSSATCAAFASTSSRSEEHTSELQSRADISYAAFCL